MSGICPAYVVGDSDKGVEDIRVVAITKPKSTTDQVEDFFPITAGECSCLGPVPAPEVPVVEKLLQRLVAETPVMASGSGVRASGIGYFDQ